MCTDTPQRYLRRILVSDFKQTKRWPIIPSLRRCQCSPPPAYLSMCTDTPQRYLRRILILDFKQKNAGRPFSFQNRFSLLWQPCYRGLLSYGPVAPYNNSLRYFQHPNFIPIPIIVGLRKERRALIGPWRCKGSICHWNYTLRITGPVSADARQ